MGTLFNSVEPPQSGATFSPDRKYRYRLMRRWAPGNMLRFVMLNPSIANGTLNDPTVRRCVGFAKGFGYHGIVVYNLFALISTNPEALLDAANPVGMENDTYLGRIHGRRVVLGWGVLKTPKFQKRAHEVIVDLLSRANSLYCLGVTEAGFPRHPLYIRGDQRLVAYRRKT